MTPSARLKRYFAFPGVRERGLTVLEVALGLSIMAVLSAAVLWAFRDSEVHRQTDYLLHDLLLLRNTALHLYGGTSDYSDVDNTVLASSGSLPKRMTRGGADLRNVFNESIVVSPATVNGRVDVGVSIRFEGIPSDVCVMASKLDLGSSLYAVEIEGSAGVHTFMEDDLPVSSPSAIASCANTVAAITWTFR